MTAVRITTWFQFTKGSVYFAIKGKKEWQNSPRLFCRLWPLFCRWFGHYFAL